MSSQKIEIQTTPKKNILKFVSNQILVHRGSYEFNNIDDAKNSPLAQQLFYFPFVKKILITANFIAIQRFDIVEWSDVQEEVKQLIEAHFLAGNRAVIKTSHSKRKEFVEVYAEATPNPSVMKFGTNKTLTYTEVEYKNVDQANKSSPLAKALFGFPFVKEVFISENYIAINKFDGVEWSDIHSEVRNFIRSYLQDDKGVFEEFPMNTSEVQKKHKGALPIGDDQGTPAKIIAILNEYIRPAVTSDGGNIAFESYDEENKVVRVLLQGACSGCPSSTMTLKNGIETMLKDMLPNQINKVVALNG